MVKKKVRRGLLTKLWWEYVGSYCCWLGKNCYCHIASWYGVGVLVCGYMILLCQCDDMVWHGYVDCGFFIVVEDEYLLWMPKVYVKDEQ